MDGDPTEEITCKKCGKTFNFTDQSAGTFLDPELFIQ